MRITYNKHTESLMEIAMIFQDTWLKNYQLRELNVESAEWKHKFVDWANEFEQMHRRTDWRNADYLSTIMVFTKERIAEVVHEHTQ